MLYSVKQLKGAAVLATDGELGSVDDAYFDDERWGVRYLVVNTGGWLTGRRVLIPAPSLGAVDWAGPTVGVRLTRGQVEASPDIDTDKPVSRQHEARLFGHYGYPYYWGGPMLWGAAAYPVPPVTPPVVSPGARAAADQAAAGASAADDRHLRSAREVIDYNVEAADGGIGHVDDFVLDDRAWAIRYVVIDTRNWLPGRHVVVAPQWIERVSWGDKRVYVDATRERIESSPELDSLGALSPEFEARLHAHYALTPYE